MHYVTQNYRWAIMTAGGHTVTRKTSKQMAFRFAHIKTRKWDMTLIVKDMKPTRKGPDMWMINPDGLETVLHEHKRISTE